MNYLETLAATAAFLRSGVGVLDSAMTNDTDELANIRATVLMALDEIAAEMNAELREIADRSDRGGHDSMKYTRIAIASTPDAIDGYPFDSVTDDELQAAIARAAELHPDSFVITYPEPYPEMVAR